MLLGKTLGNVAVAGVILGAALIASWAIITGRHLFGNPVGFDLWPFAAAWGGVMVPTFIFWTAFVTAAFALFRSRYAVYGLGLAIVIYTVYRMTVAGLMVDGEALSWVTNWLAWNSLATWSDMGAFSLHGGALFLNRLLYLSLVPLLLVLAVRWFGRQEFDAIRILHRLRPRALLPSGLRLLPLRRPACHSRFGAVLRGPGRL